MEDSRARYCSTRNKRRTMRIPIESSWIRFPVFRARQKPSASGWKERFGRRVTLTRSFADAQENPCRPTDMKYEIWYFPSIFLLPSLARISVRG